MGRIDTRTLIADDRGRVASYAAATRGTAMQSDPGVHFAGMPEPDDDAPIGMPSRDWLAPNATRPEDPTEDDALQAIADIASDLRGEGIFMLDAAATRTLARMLVDYRDAAYRG